MSKMTKEQLFECAVPIIKKIARSRKNYKFAYYESADVEQEVWVFCLQALKRYDSNKASSDISSEKQIEHFLNCHVTNRLKNLMRDKYFRPESTELFVGRAKTRMNLINALPLEIYEANQNGIILGSANNCCDPVSFFIAKEIEELILSELPEDLIESFIDLLGGNKLKKSIEMRLQEIIAKILQGIDNEQ